MNWTTRECYWQSSKANPILSETIDCIQSTDYLYTKPDLLLNLRMFASMEKRNLKAIFPRHIGSVPPHSYALISTMLAILRRLLNHQFL